MCADGKNIRIWINASHAVHANMKGRVGTYASIGKGAVVSSANRIKLNTTSSTEIYLVSLSTWSNLGYADEGLLLDNE